MWYGIHQWKGKIYIYIYPVQIYMLGRKKLCTSAISLPPGQMKGRNTIDKYLRRTLLFELVFSSSGGSGDQQKISPLVSDDKILEEMVNMINLDIFLIPFLLGHKPMCFCVLFFFSSINPNPKNQTGRQSNCKLG
jgi:hypothetical protein